MKIFTIGKRRFNQLNCTNLATPSEFSWNQLEPRNSNSPRIFWTDLVFLVYFLSIIWAFYCLLINQHVKWNIDVNVVSNKIWKIIRKQSIKQSRIDYVMLCCVLVLLMAYKLLLLLLLFYEHHLIIIWAFCKQCLNIFRKIFDHNLNIISTLCENFSEKLWSLFDQLLSILLVFCEHHLSILRASYSRINSLENILSIVGESFKLAYEYSVRIFEHFSHFLNWLNIIWIFVSIVQAIFFVLSARCLTLSEYHSRIQWTLS